MTMRRREFIAALMGFACTVPWTAQARKENPIVGVFLTTQGLETAFQQGLGDFGYIVGQNISLVRKDGVGTPDQINQRATELVAAKPDVIFGGGSQTSDQTSNTPGTPTCAHRISLQPVVVQFPVLALT
jgi:hypothetical protein